mgnify:CR=1 FL=1
MRNLPSAVAAHLAAAGTGMHVEILVWLVARDRATGAPEPFGVAPAEPAGDIQLGGNR